ncbi:MAG: DUF3990 domain-containing protein [Oscillospiraceae bacterium]|nr:DUF3990 domain-containing protein [Oscillospiraceae bacterium]
MFLYHTGFQEIREPDVHYGRKNADFGQGFYMTAEKAFASRWATEQKGASAWMNSYELDLRGLRIYRFEERNAAWYDYIRSNRAGRADSIPDADIVVGPIANDTIYNTYGILTSGLLQPEEALRLLRIGPEYVQYALKTEKAAAQLRWLSVEEIPAQSIRQFRALLAEEEKEYQKLLSAEMEAMTES